MTDADGMDWPYDPEKDWVKKLPPDTPIITGRNGTSFSFDSVIGRTFEVNLRDVNPNALRIMYGGRIDSHYPNLKSFTREFMMTGEAIQALPQYPTIAEWREMKDRLMTDNEEVLRRRIEQARRDIDEYAERLSWLESLPKEPATSEDGDGPVVYFRKTFGGGDMVPENGYQYAAVKVGDDRWYITGSKAMGAPVMTWRELLAFVFMRETKETSPTIWMVAEWTQL